MQKAFYPEGKDCAHFYVTLLQALFRDELNIEICIQDSAHALLQRQAPIVLPTRTNLAIGDSKQTQISNINVLGKGIVKTFHSKLSFMKAQTQLTS